MPDAVSTFLEEVRTLCKTGLASVLRVHASGYIGNVFVVADTRAAIENHMESNGAYPVAFIEDLGGSVDLPTGKYLTRTMTITILAQSMRDDVGDTVSLAAQDLLGSVVTAMATTSSLSSKYCVAINESGRDPLTNELTEAAATITYEYMLRRA